VLIFLVILLPTTLPTYITNVVVNKLTEILNFVFDLLRLVVLSLDQLVELFVLHFFYSLHFEEQFVAVDVAAVVVVAVIVKHVVVLGSVSAGVK